MSTISDAINTPRNNLTPTDTAALRPLVPPIVDLQPSGTLMLRCPLPPVAVTPDTLRSYYLGSKIPQFRALTAGQQGSGSNSNGTTNVSVITTTNNGNSGTTTSGAPQKAQNVSTVTSTLSPGQGWKGTLSVSTYKALQLLSVTANSAARIELYGTAAVQSSDFSRGLDVAPGAGVAQNIITDVALDTSPFQWTFQNRVAGNGDNPQNTVLYITVTNLGASSKVITISLSYVPLES